MNNIPFQKFHGFGNDYIVFTADDVKDVSDISAFARSICHRHTGAGSDGIAILEKQEDGGADYSCAIINPDGSEAGFSGNGTRCAVAFLYREGFWNAPDLRLKTKSGIKNYGFLKRDRETYWYLAELGKPEFEKAKVPFVPENGYHDTIFRLDSEHLTYGHHEPFEILALNVGNPVCAIFVKEFDFDWHTLGAGVESHVCFPERTNVVFVRNLDKSNIDIRIWERAAGETSSSGTCSIAAAVASAHTGRAGRKISVHAVGGTTETEWRDDGEMLITGSAEYVYSGKWPRGS